MAENLDIETNKNLAEEIELLSRQIEAKRKELENRENIVAETEYKQEIRNFLQQKDEKGGETVDEEIGGGNYRPTTDSPAAFSNLDADHSSVVNQLITVANQGNLKKAIKTSKRYPPAIIDAFHDFLVDYLYDYLKAKKLI